MLGPFLFRGVLFQLVLNCVALAEESQTETCAAGDMRGPGCVQRTKEGLPKQGRIALLLRGQSFRGKSTAMSRQPDEMSHCMAGGRFYTNQVEATQSFLDNILGPLERLNNTVDMVVTDGPCAKAHIVHDMYGPHRFIAQATFNSTSQGDGIRRSLDLFKTTIGSSKAESYDLIISTRHDILWKMPITRWPVNFTHLNVRWIRKLSKTTGSLCDLLFMMPGDLFDSFDGVVGKKPCLPVRAEQGPSTGHLCYNPLAAAVGISRIGSVCKWTDRDHCEHFADNLEKPRGDEVETS